MFSWTGWTYCCERKTGFQQSASLHWRWTWLCEKHCNQPLKGNAGCFPWLLERDVCATLEVYMCYVCPILCSRFPPVWKSGSTHGVGCETTIVPFSTFYLVFMAFMAASPAEPGLVLHCCCCLDLFLLRLYSGLLSGRAQCLRPVDYTKSSHSLTGIPSVFLRYKNNYFYFLVVSSYYYYFFLLNSGRVDPVHMSCHWAVPESPRNAILKSYK